MWVALSWKRMLPTSYFCHFLVFSGLIFTVFFVCASMMGLVAIEKTPTHINAIIVTHNLFIAFYFLLGLY